MNNSKKFSLIISLIVFTTVFLNLKAVSVSERIPNIANNYEEEYSKQICDGQDNIVKAGCSVIAGQAVRGIPAMAFGASFDEIKGCVERMEQRSTSTTSVTINTDDLCVQFGLLNPGLDTSKFVFDNNAPIEKGDYSFLGATKQLYQLNQNIIQSSFDNSYFAFKAVENIPVAKTAFAQNNQVGSPGELYILGGFFRDTTYTVWVTVRNIAYGLIGVLSIVLGLTLMSSNSIFDNNAKWRLSLEQAIPRVIISVILIQFSYLLGETLLFISNNSNFEPIFRYIFNIPVNGGGWANLALGLGALSPVTILGAVLSWAAALYVPGLGQFLLISMLGLGLWYVWRLLVLWWYNFTLVIAVCLFTMASPVIIALSLLPGEAGALQTRRYFSTLVSLLSRTFLLQLISVGPTILIFTLLDWTFRQGGFVAGLFSPLTVLFPLIGAIIVLGYADNVQNLANQFARNVTGADPVGAQPQGR